MYETGREGGNVVHFWGQDEYYRSFAEKRILPGPTPCVIVLYSVWSLWTCLVKLARFLV